MLDVNPHITVETFNEQLNSENALRICDGYDVVSDRTTHHARRQNRATKSVRRMAEHNCQLKSATSVDMVSWCVQQCLRKPPPLRPGYRDKAV